MASSEPLPTIDEEAPKEVDPVVSDVGDAGSAEPSVEAVPIEEGPPTEPRTTPKKRAREPAQKKPTRAKPRASTAAPAASATPAPDVSSPQFWAGLLQTHRAAQAAEREGRYSGFNIA